VSISILASECPPEDPGFCSPTVLEFFPKPFAEFDLGPVHFALTRITVISWIATLAVLVFFVMSVRRPQLVPAKLQWAGEAAYSFVRDGIAREVIGKEGLRFAPYLAVVFFFILANNVMGIIPFAQLSPNSKIALPAVLAGLSYLLFNWVGIRQQGIAQYIKGIALPPGVPKPMYVLITPIEIASTLIFRPLTLAIRLFANMFAGHLLLVIFALGTVYLLQVGNFSVVFAPVSFVMAIVMTFFELLVQVLQAYVFTVLTATYLAGALEEAH
jgi:F-type H+-transporting ATPase subunit a